VSGESHIEKIRRELAALVRRIAALERLALADYRPPLDEAEILRRMETEVPPESGGV
jgi:hypothetical protein